MNTILVTGATGTLGKALLSQLSNRLFKVKAAIRIPEAIRETEKQKNVLFDFFKSETWDEALRDVHCVFLVVPPWDPTSDKQIIPFIQRMEHLHIYQCVLVSAIGIAHNKKSALYKIEKYLSNTKIYHTILRPNFFMDNFTSGFLAPAVNKQNSIYVSAGTAQTSFIAASDVASVAIQAFIDPIHFNTHEYDLTGPEAYDHFRVADILSNALHKDITYYDVPEADMRSAMLQRGMDESAVDMLCEMYENVRNGWNEKVTNYVEVLTGHKPISLHAFIGAKSLAH